MEIKYCCETCGKKYIRKSSLDKHAILCDFLSKTKREKDISKEEEADLPSYIQLTYIVQELSLKYSKLEKQMEEMQKFIEKKKKKINVISWLNSNIEPSNTFTNWMNQLELNESHFEFLMENSIIQSIHFILEENLPSSNKIYPIKCFTQKTNLFYICESNEPSNCIWSQMTFEDFSKLLKNIQNKLLIILSKWRITNKDQIDNNDSISILYNKTIIKLMNISFSQDASFGKIKSNLYNYLKTDVKNMIEYEFEF